MNYSALLHGLIAEMKQGAQYKRIPQPFNVFLIIGMIPMILAFIAQSIAYRVQAFFFKALSAPAEYLHKWLRGQKDEVGNLTQAVMYFVCLPYIFFLQSLLALASLGFFFSWFGLQVTGYLLTLGGIRFQAYVSDATFDEEEACEHVCTPEDKVAIIFVCVVFGLFLLQLIANHGFITLLYFIAVAIVNPVMFHTYKAKKKEEHLVPEEAE